VDVIDVALHRSLRLQFGLHIQC